VIVNAGRTVDKPDFFHMLKGLRAALTVEQTLRLNRIETGQKICRHWTRQFRTFDPVDIQQLIHIAGSVRRFFGQRRGAGSTSRRCRAANSSGVGLFFSKRLQERHAPIRSRSTMFFDRIAAFRTNPQVYKQKLVYRMMIVVNGGTLLWISRVLSTTSIVYGSHKPVGWSCMCLEAKLDKNRACAKNRVSPHFVPVDIHTFIHSPAASFALIIW